MKTSAYIFALLFACAFITSAASAQPPGEDRPMKKIEQFKKMKLLENLDLDEATANKFLAKYDTWEKAIMQLTQDRNDLAMQMKTAMEKKADDAELNGILDKLFDVTVKTDNAKHDMFKDLRALLTPRQAVNLAIFEQQFQRKLHESIDKLRDRDRDRGGDRWHE